MTTTNIRNFAGHSPKLGDSVYLDPQATVIGKVTIGNRSSVWPQTTIRGDINTITIGSNTNIQDNSIIHVTHASRYNPNGFAVKIGDHVTIGHGVIIHGATIADLCLIGMGSQLLDGATLEAGVMVGAGSLVTGKQPLTAGLWVGRPARFIRPLTADEQEFLHYSASNYAKLAQEYILG